MNPEGINDDGGISQIMFFRLRGAKLKPTGSAAKLMSRLAGDEVPEDAFILQLGPRDESARTTFLNYMEQIRGAWGSVLQDELFGQNQSLDQDTINQGLQEADEAVNNIFGFMYLCDPNSGDFQQELHRVAGEIENIGRTFCNLHTSKYYPYYETKIKHAKKVLQPNHYRGLKKVGSPNLKSLFSPTVVGNREARGIATSLYSACFIWERKKRQTHKADKMEQYEKDIVNVNEALFQLKWQNSAKFNDYEPLDGDHVGWGYLDGYWRAVLKLAIRAKELIDEACD